MEVRKKYGGAHMKIVNLIEDTEGLSGCMAEHGLCFYIETNRHKLLLDTGATDGFISNAARLGVDLTQVDTVIISHGHYDHAGGVLAFVKGNPTAKIYIHAKAVGEFYNCKYPTPKYIGMDPAIPSLPQVTFLDGNLTIDEELSLFTGVTGRRLWPKGNASLRKKSGGDFVQDTFEHEQYLVVTEGDKRVLLSGCAHNGILNILATYHTLYGENPTHVITGFHTLRDTYTQEDDAILTETAQILAGMNTQFYSGHCTGTYALEVMGQILGDRLTAIHSGDVIL